MTSLQSSGGTRTGLALFIAGTVAIGVVYAVAIALGAPPAWAPWFLAFGAAATAVGLFVLGAATRGTVQRPIAFLLGALFVVLLASFSAALAMAPSEGAGGPLLLGLPRRLGIVFYGVGFLPLLALPIAFALTFRADDGPDSGAAPRA